MHPRDKYTVFTPHARGYRKGIHKVPKWTRVCCMTGLLYALLIKHSTVNPQDKPERFLKVYFSAPHMTCILYITPPYNLKQDDLDFALLDAL